MIRLLLAVAIGMVCSCPADAQKRDLRELYRQIDEAIDHSPEYVADYEREIAGVRKEYEQTKDAEQKCRFALALYGKYRAFLNDSLSLTYLTICTL